MTRLIKKTSLLEVAADERVSYVKAQLEVTEGIPVTEQHLSYKGQELQDDRRLADYSITVGSDLVLRQQPPALTPRAMSTEIVDRGYARGASLGDRLKRATQLLTAQPPGVFTWGKMKGKTFEDVFNEDPGYVQWCADHLAANPTPSQVEWVAFIKKKVEELEAKLTSDACGGGAGQP